MQLTNSKRKYILFGLLVFILISFLTAKTLANQQDEEYILNNALYQQASQLVTQGNYIEAEEYINKLILRQPNSEDVNYLGGLISASLGEYIQATILLQKTLDINPYKVEDAIFMLQFGEVLYFAERYEDSKIILEKCRDWGWVPEEYPTYQERVAELITQIENM